MTGKLFVSAAMQAVRTGLVTVSVCQFAVGNSVAVAATAPKPSRDNDTATPIKHVIVIVGENRSFDHVFATYVPKKGESVMNLLSEGVIKATTRTERKARTFRRRSSSCGDGHELG